MIIQGTTLRGGNYYSTLTPAVAGSWVTSGLMMNLLTAPTTTTSGTIWADASGNGNNGTLVTGSSYGSFAYTSTNGGGVTASGSVSGGASTVITTSYALTSPFTVEMWCKPTGARTWSTLWGSDVYSSDTGWWALWESSGTLQSGGVPGGIGYSTSYTQTTPQHYVFTLTGSTYTFYLNGVATSGSGTYGVPSGGNGSSTLWFGSRHPNAGGSTPTDALDGTFYQMRVYNQALSSSQVTQNYSGTRGTIGV
jgi:hypothetical protein